jgi:1-acyl-sn-glycerol-3-phosphate acyltransferase
LGKPRRMQERRGWAFTFCVAILKPLLLLLTKHDWVGGENIPEKGGAVIAANHASHIDPLTFAHFLYDNGRLPRYLAKEVLFRVFFVGRVLKGAKQIPVYRESADASKAFSAAVDAVRDGECVAIYPEATLTRDPDQWPMMGKTGAARVALETGAPVVPIAQWGPQVLLAPYSKRPHLFPRPTMHVWAGPPVDLEDVRDRPIDAALLHEVTERIMVAITSLLEEIRGQQAPATRYDPKSEGLPVTGNPLRSKDKHDKRRSA